MGTRSNELLVDSNGCPKLFNQQSSCQRINWFFNDLSRHAFFILLLRTRFPLFVFNNTGDPYSYLLNDGKPMIYLIYNIFHYSLSSALFAVTALWVSTYIPNRYIALASPLALYFVIFRFMTGLDIPQYLKINNIVEGGYHTGVAFQTFLYKLIPVLVLCGLMGFAAVRQIRRRVLRD